MVLRLLTLFAAVALATAQSNRILVKAAGGGGGGTPAWVTSRTYDPPFEDPPTLGDGQCYDNMYGVKVCQITPFGWGHYYVLPQAMNAANNWIYLFTTTGGGEGMRWIGPVTGNTIALGSITSLPTRPTGVTDSGYLWHPGNTGNSADDYKMYKTSKGSMSEMKLWELACTANCNSASATWGWNMVFDFAAANTIDWNNAAFSELDTAGKNEIHLFPASISPDGNRLAFAIRRTTKVEFGSVIYTRNAAAGCPAGNCTSVQYVQANRYPGATTPALPDGSVMGAYNGMDNSWNYHLIQTIISASAGAPCFLSSPYKFDSMFVGPINTALSNYSNMELFTGAYGPTCSQTGHGIIRSGAQVAIGGQGYWGTMPGSVNGTPDWAYGLKMWDFTQPSTPPNYYKPSKQIFYIPQSEFQNGLHVGGSTRPSREKWVFPLFYRDFGCGWCSDTTVNRTFSREIVAVDQTIAGLPLPDITRTQPLPVGNIRRIAQHNSCMLCCPAGTESTCGYNAQGHPNLSFDGSRLIWKSTWNRNSASNGVAAFMAFVPSDIVY